MQVCNTGFLLICHRFPGVKWLDSVWQIIYSASLDVNALPVLNSIRTSCREDGWIEATC